MRKISLTLFIALSSLVVWADNPTQIKNFEVLMEYLKTGNEVRVILHYSKCQLISDNQIKEESPDAIGGMNLDVWEYFAPMTVYNKRAFLVSSSTKLIQNPKSDGYVYNYVKLKFYDDNSVRIVAQYLDANTLEVLMSESFYGEIANGKNDAGIFIYIE